MVNNRRVMFSVTVIVVALLSAIMVLTLRASAKGSWAGRVKEQQPIWLGDQSSPMARIMNEMPVLPDWTAKEADELVGYMTLVYPPAALTEAATPDDIKNMSISIQAMTTVVLRMSNGAPIDKGAAVILKTALVNKLKSPMSLDRIMALACLLNAGLLIDPEVIKAAESLESDQLPEIKRLAQRNVRIARQPEYRATWERISQIRGY